MNDDATEAPIDFETSVRCMAFGFHDILPRDDGMARLEVDITKSYLNGTVAASLRNATTNCKDLSHSRVMWRACKLNWFLGKVGRNVNEPMESQCKEKEWCSIVSIASYVPCECSSINVPVGVYRYFVRWWSSKMAWMGQGMGLHTPVGRERMPKIRYSVSLHEKSHARRETYVNQHKVPILQGECLFGWSGRLFVCRLNLGGGGSCCTSTLGTLVHNLGPSFTSVSGTMSDSVSHGSQECSPGHFVFLFVIVDILDIFSLVGSCPQLVRCFCSKSYQLYIVGSTLATSSDTLRAIVPSLSVNGDRKFAKFSFFMILDGSRFHCSTGIPGTEQATVIPGTLLAQVPATR